MTTDEPRPGTTAAVEAKVGRLDDKITALELRMAAVELGQKHQGEVVGLQFETVKAALAQTNASLTTLIAKLEADRIAGSEAASDPMRTPAGRQVVGAIGEVKEEMFGMADRLAGLEKKIAVAAGGLAVVSVVMNLLVPIAVRLFFG